ncbi:MAG: hypothetical protein IPH05_11005 [Flavobacteriales bacterium]|nr:hypothetical protein [Flavobacteriales bacterium]
MRWCGSLFVETDRSVGTVGIEQREVAASGELRDIEVLKLHAVERSVAHRAALQVGDAPCGIERTSTTKRSVQGLRYTCTAARAPDALDAHVAWREHQHGAAVIDHERIERVVFHRSRSSSVLTTLARSVNVPSG